MSTTATVEMTRYRALQIAVDTLTFQGERDAARYRRMKARPKGSHTPAKIAAAQQLAEETLAAADVLHAMMLEEAG